jgi:hypothetical protein
VRRAPVIVRRLLPHRLALASAMITALLSAALLAALASFSATVTSYAVRKSLTNNPATGISVSGSVTSQAAAARADAQVRDALRRALPVAPLAIVSSDQSDYLGIPAAVGGSDAETHVISLPQLPSHATLIAGTWPGARRNGPEQVAAPSVLAARLHLAPGATIVLREATTGAREPVEITGIFSPRQQASPYWSLDPVTGPQLSGGFVIYTPFVTSPAGMAAGPIPVSSAAWLGEPDVATIGAGGLSAAAGQLQAGLNGLSAGSGLQNPVVASGLPQLLSGLATALVVARSQLAIGVLAFLVIAGATVALATTLLSQQREAEAALLRSRGASRRQMAATVAAEAVLLVLPVAAAGPVLGGLLLPWLGRHGPLAHSALPLPIAFPPVAWLAAGAAALGCALIIAQGWLRAAGSPVRARAQRGRQRALASAARSGADVALIALAVLAGWQLARYSAPVSTGLDGSIGVDPVLVSAPVLALAAGAVVMLRLLPAVVRLGDRAAARRRDLTAAVAAWQISRRPLRQAGPILLAVLAVATTVLAAGQWSSWQRSAQDQASFSTGADVRVDLPAQAPLQIGQVASLTEARGVTGAVPVMRSAFGLPNGASATLLALDPRQATSVATIRPDLADGSPAALLRRITPRGAPPGVPVPGRPTRLLITAQLAAPKVTQAVLFVDLRDAFGVLYQVQAGLIPADGRAHELTLAVAGPGRAADPLRITGYALQYLMPPVPVFASMAAARAFPPQHSATLSIASIRAVGATGQLSAPFAAMPAGARVTSTATAGSGLEVVPAPAVRDASARGTRLAVTFLPGRGVGPKTKYCGPPLFKFPCGPYTLVPGTLTVAAGVRGALPAIATRAFLAGSGLSRGSTVPVALGGTTVTFKIVDVVSDFPTIGGPAGGLVADQASVQQALAVAGLGPQPVTEWWLQASRPPPLTGIPGAVLTDRAAVATSLLASPLAAAPQLAMLAIAAAAIILAAAGFLVSAATARERSRDLALLAALGATRRQLTGVLCLEQAALAVPAAAAGLLLGAVLARLVVPAVTLTAAGAHPVPAVLVQVPLAVPGALALAIAAVPVLIAALGTGSRTGVTARTRMEAET